MNQNEIFSNKAKQAQSTKHLIFQFEQIMTDTGKNIRVISNDINTSFIQVNQTGMTDS